MKRFLLRLWYFFFKPFSYFKCVDCKWDGKVDPYCKPPLGICYYEKKGEIK